MNCPNCEEIIEGDDWEFCPSCGDRLSERKRGEPIENPFSWIRYLMHQVMGVALLVPLGIFFYGRMVTLSVKQDQLAMYMTMYGVGGILFCLTLAIYIQLPDYDEKAKWERLRDQLRGLGRNNHRSYVIQLMLICVLSGTALIASTGIMLSQSVILPGMTIDQSRVTYQLDVLNIKMPDGPGGSNIGHLGKLRSETSMNSVHYRKGNEVEWEHTNQLTEGNNAWSRSFEAPEGERLSLEINSDLIRFRAKILVDGHVVKQEEGKHIHVQHTLPYQ